MQAIDLEIARRFTMARLKRSIVRLKWHIAATRFELAMRRHDRALKYAYKYGYNPGQPRDEIGRWTDANGNVVNPSRIRLAGDIPTGDSPEVPKEPPPTTRLTNILIRTLARVLGPRIWIAVEAGSWIYEHKEEISSFFDPPKSLKELQDAANTPEKGYDVHHVVERNSLAKDGSETDLIDAPENKVRIPRWKHWEINKWFETENDDFGGLTPREYLKGKSWDERTRVGLGALRKFRVLRP